MNSLRRSPLPRWFAHAAPGVLALVPGDHARAAQVSPWPNDGGRHDRAARGSFTFAYDGVLGTSLDIQLDATSVRDAHACEQSILAEIDRLEKILSPRDPQSEFSRVRAGAAVGSRELADVLTAYEIWSARTHGALHANLAEVAALWRDAARTDREPDAAALRAAFAQPRALAIAALGKAFVVDRAVAVARAFASAGLLNVGGDLRAWGDRSWLIDVTNPFDPADNGPPLARFPLRNAAVATSGGYARAFTLGARRFSHLLDPRTLRPLPIDRAATVVATDCVTANALSAALCVLDAVEGVPLARAFALDHLRVRSASDRSATRGFGTLAAMAPAAPQPVAVMLGNWPANFQVTIDVSLKVPAGTRAKRPYVAVWVEDAERRLVRTLAVWGDGAYLSDLTQWWRAVGGTRISSASVTRATRYPGAYTLTWDGRDNRGQAVAQGDYTLFVEINREHGHHTWESATITCGDSATAAELRATAESDAGAVTYGPRGD